MRYISRLLLVMLICTSWAHALCRPDFFIHPEDDYIMQIDYGVPLPIAVIPFGWNGTPGTQPIDLHVTIANDLARNGNFATMDEGEMPQKPVDFGHVNFRDWQLLRMENIVIGNLKQTQAGDYEIEFRLLDVFGGSQLTGFRIKANRRQQRWPHLSEQLFSFLKWIHSPCNQKNSRRCSIFVSFTSAPVLIYSARLFFWRSGR